ADASHELRTPLTIMRGEVEVALRTVRDTKEYQRVLNSILEEMNRVSSIVDHLLLLARADSGQIQVERQPVEINEILEDLHPQALLLAQPKRTAVTIREQGRVMVLGDSGKLRQLFLNLIDNAIKYTPEGGSVEVRLGSENGFAVVAVSDTGIGIADEDVPHIFDRFFRADRARNREIGGTGLGLAICQWVIEAHHGWIDVQTALGEGSTFTVYIPRVMPSAIHSGDEAEALAQPVH
ncbi:MAG: two-component sensor histidine kinase, partial [Armatimonadetes bacterium]|nr:two-component sensor histidine kinase [Armatimonadota bacterium]